ncbi:MAG TPA: thiamine phosphate synthase, partial [Alphaproteobacteria bacterium]|nr:thiamine phosphate synthase [Alphaproteobacteria bacterium]
CGRLPLKAAATLAKQALKLNCAAHRAVRRAWRRNGRPLPPLIMMTDAARLGDPLETLDALPRGSLVILRDYDHPQRARLAARLARACRRRGLLLSVAGSGRLAARIRADGLHLPEGLARRAAAWRSRKEWLITTAAHSLPAIRRAETFGADAVLLSPVFPTASHPGGDVLGVLRFARLVREARLPVYALGGISPGSARRLNGSGAAGLAGIGVFTPTPHRERP